MDDNPIPNEVTKRTLVAIVEALESVEACLGAMKPLPAGPKRELARVKSKVGKIRDVLAPWDRI